MRHHIDDPRAAKQRYSHGEWRGEYIKWLCGGRTAWSGLIRQGLRRDRREARRVLRRLVLEATPTG